jgi:hypothetical protein
MIIKTNKLLNGSAELASFQRPRAPSRALEEIYKLPGIALVTPSEASRITQLTESALAVRRCKGEWPRYLKFGRLVRYRLGDLIACPNEDGRDLAGVK